MNTIAKKLVKAVGKYVTTEHVDNLIRNYKKERWMKNSEKLGKEDSMGVWYSADELEEFIQTAKLHGADGIRIHFGVYGEKASRPGTEGKQTIVFVATSSEGSSDRIEHKEIYIQRDGATEVLAYNSGAMFPPLPGVPPVTQSTQLGSLMVAGKDGLTVI